MNRYILRRLLLLLPTLLGVSVLVFGLMRLLPGDVVQVLIGPELNVTDEQRAALYRMLGLDAPLHIQFLRWLGGVLRGDLGFSLRTDQPVLTWVSFFDRPWINLQIMILPVLSLSVAQVAVVMRMMRSTMLEVLGRDYIRTARAKGLSEALTLARHALKNAFIPVVTVMGVQVGLLLSGAVVIEQIYGLPGIGWMILNGIYQRDYTLVQGGVLFVAVAFVLVNLVVDLLYAYLDPRIRYT
jgi:peptide/nickel transport system permease protein